MKFEQLYSSSSSNLYTVIAASGKRLLLECGLPWKKLVNALNYDFNGICGCLLTHEHKDHSKSVLDVMKAGIDVYASEGTFIGCGIDNNQRRARKIENRSTFTLEDTFDVFAFDLRHDSAEPLGFVVHDIGTDENLLFAPDTAYIRQRFSRIRFNIIAIECSYDKEILLQRVETKDINETVAKRLLDSHQEKRVAMRYIEKFCNRSRCREIHLLHMSGDNLDKKQTKKDFEERFFIETVICKKKRKGS